MNLKEEVLRLHSANQVGTDWHETGKMHDSQIEQIKDPSGEHHNIAITSIPSPFARIHLTENAFERVHKMADLDPSRLHGNSIHHRLISEALDVAQLFFEYDNVRARNMEVDIVRWNIEDNIAALNRNPKHAVLGHALELFIKNSAQNSGLSLLQDIYILRWNYLPVGGTCASTLFFSSPNIPDPKEQGQQIVFGEDSLFDNSFCPLYNREKDFIRYLYQLFYRYPKLKQTANLMWKYMEVSLRQINRTDPDLFKELKALENKLEDTLRQDMDRSYSIANFAGPNTQIEILPDVVLYKRKEGESSAETDFAIGSFSQPGEVNQKYSQLHPDQKVPLLLQDKLQASLLYMGSRWRFETKVPPVDHKPLQERQLPDINNKYPYLTISDFLEDYLLELPFEAEQDSFFMGHLLNFNLTDRAQAILGDRHFALPIKPLFFSFFEPEDLMRQLPDGRPVFSIEKLSSSSFKVNLRLPISKNNQFLNLERIYYRNAEPHIDAQHNDGAIRSSQLNLAIMPLLQTAKHLRVGLVDIEHKDYEIKFFKASQEVHLQNVKEQKRSLGSTGALASSQYFALQEPFDYLQLTQEGRYAAIILPKWRKVANQSKSFSFAIDFGTTNTHIEYSEGHGNPKTFDIGKQDAQLAQLNNQEYRLSFPELNSYFLKELLPLEIGGEYHFPSRTALTERQNLNWQQAAQSYLDYNPTLYFEQDSSLPQSKIITNLKWGDLSGNSDEGQRRVRAYLESLMFMIHNKVLLNGGDLNKVELLWFYPSSMSRRSKSELRRNWEDLAKAYLGPTAKISDLPESEAPYYEHADTAIGSQPSVNIDIGGGTTDVQVFEKGQPTFHTSFRFAGDTLFGNGYGRQQSLENGFVKAFSSQVENYLDANPELGRFMSVYQQLSDPAKGRSADLNSFFFSLEGNIRNTNPDLHFSFAEKLRQDEDFSIAFYTFHLAILYHTACWMKAQDLAMPQYIFYSGNTSKSLDYLDNDPRKELLEELAGRVFERVYQQEYDRIRLELRVSSQPKEATCKGGLKLLRHQNRNSGRISSTVLLSSHAMLLGDRTGPRLTYNQMIEDKERNFKEGALKSYLDFVDLILDLGYEFRWSDLGIPVGKIQDYKQVLSYNLEAFYEAGLRERLQLTDPADLIEETLFFYPLVGALHRLILEIGNKRI